WRRGLARRWWTVAGAAVLVLGAPYLVRYLGRGIAPPAGGVGFALWMSWETAVATAAMALILAAAAPGRGPGGPPRVPRPHPAPCRCSSAWELRHPRRRLAPPASCTPGGSPRRLPLTTTRRVLRCGRAPASPRGRSAWRAWTCRRRWWRPSSAPLRRRAARGS